MFNKNFRNYSNKSVFEINNALWIDKLSTFTENSTAHSFYKTTPIDALQNSMRRILKMDAGNESENLVEKTL